MQKDSLWISTYLKYFKTQKWSSDSKALMCVLLSHLQVDVKKAFSMNSHPRTKKIFVGGVPPTFDKEKLEDYFKVFGEVRMYINMK